MDLKDIMSVSGYSGLFRFISQGRNGIIVESFSDHKRMFVNATQKVSSLSDIAIFTGDGEVPLKDVFKKIHELHPGEQAPDTKSDPAELRKFMESVLPEYDRNKVYVSDIKKLVAWYNTLLALDLVKFDDEVKSEGETDASAEKASENEQKAAETDMVAEEKEARPVKKTNDQKGPSRPKTPKKAK